MSVVPSVVATVGLGSNLQDPEHQVRTALDELAAIPTAHGLVHSRLYRSRPMGPSDQPEFVNAVARFGTRLPAVTLLEALQEIERRHGRVRGPVRWGPRTLDLDLLLYGEQRIREERLTVPHPGMRDRAFVLCPLAEIAPDLRVPGLGTVADLLRDCPDGGLRPL
jgi:2-amino-4-hydroxy-6-hydroxymethyldihydropteridine diphosphokinase